MDHKVMEPKPQAEVNWRERENSNITKNRVQETNALAHFYKRKIMSTSPPILDTLMLLFLCERP